MSELVSVIIPNFNGERFLERCIRSVLNQTYKNWELLVIDDCSTDASKEILQKYKSDSNKITVFNFQKNSGVAIARNKGIELAKGAYIAFLDNDDYWLPNKLETQLDFMKKNNYELSFSSYYSVDEEGQSKKLVKAPSEISYTKLLTTNYIGCLTTMYDVRALGKQYFPLIKKRQDWALWLKISKNGTVAHGIEEPLAVYTRRKSSMSSNKFGLLKYNWKVYREMEQLSVFKSLYLIVILVVTKFLR